MDGIGALIDALLDEEGELDALLRTLDDASWETPTPAPTWAVRDQVGHLAYSEEMASMALVDPDRFLALRQELLAAVEPAESAPRRRAATAEPAEILDWWTDMSSATIAGLRGRQHGDRVPWVVGSMSAASFATARLMETWAHGQDIVDGIGAVRVPTNRLRHVAHLGVSTRSFSYTVRGRSAPDVEIFVELEAPDGDAWTWGHPGGSQRVTGPALDFCLLVTQRRHRDELRLQAVGADASEWLSIAQAFAGPPTNVDRGGIKRDDPGPAGPPTNVDRGGIKRDDPGPAGPP